MIKEYYKRTLSTTTFDVVSTSEAKAHLRVTHSDDDTYIAALIAAATDIAENFIDGDIRKYDTEIYLSAWPSVYIFNRLPVLEVNSVITLDDDVDHFETPTNQIVSYGNHFASIKFIETFDLDDDYDYPIKIEATTGYASASVVPNAIKQAILMILAHLYENREDVSEMTLKEIPMNSQYLLHPYKYVAV